MFKQLRFGLLAMCLTGLAVAQDSLESVSHFEVITVYLGHDLVEPLLGPDRQSGPLFKQTQHLRDFIRIYRGITLRNFYLHESTGAQAISR